MDYDGFVTIKDVHLCKETNTAWILFYNPKPILFWRKLDINSLANDDLILKEEDRILWLKHANDVYKRTYTSKKLENLKTEGIVLLKTEVRKTISKSDPYIDRFLIMSCKENL